jgi:hypothetical protein
MNFIPKNITKLFSLGEAYNRMKYDRTRVLVATVKGTLIEKEF